MKVKRRNIARRSRVIRFKKKCTWRSGSLFFEASGRASARGERDVQRAKHTGTSRNNGVQEKRDSRNESRRRSCFIVSFRKEREAYFVKTHRDTSSWETARGVAAPWRAREDAWRDSCEYGSVELFSSADTEPFCFPVHSGNEREKETKKKKGKTRGKIGLIHGRII